VAQSRADHTNVVQTLNIQLFAVTQGSTTTFGNIVTKNVNTVSISTRRVIDALAAATANTFSSTSKLVVVTPLDGEATMVQVRDGTNAPVDVTGFFSIQQLSGSVDNSVSNTRSGRSSDVGYSIQRFVLQDANGDSLSLHFDVNGFTVDSSNSSQPGTEFDAGVSGAGDRNGNLIILQGVISLHGHATEVVQDVFTTS